MAQRNWRSVYEDLGALWIHSEDVSKPHAELSSLKHSNGFCNSGLVTRYPFLVTQAIADLIQMDGLFIDENEVDDYTVYGSAMGAITLAHEMGRQLGVHTGYTEKVDGVLQLKRFSVKEGEKIILIEDVITSGKSTLQTWAAVTAVGGIISQKLFCLVNRSGKDHLNGLPIVALVEHEMPIWDVPAGETCPLCEQGSKAIRPKDNWAELTGK